MRDYDACACVRAPWGLGARWFRDFMQNYEFIEYLFPGVLEDVLKFFMNLQVPSRPARWGHYGRS